MTSMPLRALRHALPRPCGLPCGRTPSRTIGGNKRFAQFLAIPTVSLDVISLVASSCGQIPSDLVVKSQIVDIIDLILQIVGHPNGVHRPCRNRKSRGAVLSTSEGQWATTKFDGVCNFPPLTGAWVPVRI